MKAAQFLRELLRAGWKIERVNGSHHILIHPDKTGITITLPVHGSKELGRGLELKIRKIAGL